VKAEVRPKTAANDQQFEVKGPNATASVRGTGIDTDGVSILVNHEASTSPTTSHYPFGPGR